MNTNKTIEKKNDYKGSIVHYHPVFFSFFFFFSFCHLKKRLQNFGKDKPFIALNTEHFIEACFV